jgi:hypothetical protein
MSLYEIPCVYGRSQNEDTALVYEKGIYVYYCVSDSCNVNKCYLEDFVTAMSENVLDVEEIPDIDTISSLDPIGSLGELENFIDS